MIDNSPKTTSIFLSYARDDDEPFVARLHADLCAAGFDVWFDRESMPSRQLTFHQEIKDALRKRDKLVYVAGPRAALSDYVREEWQFALELDKPVVPILRKGDYANIPGGLSLLHCEDFRKDSNYSDQLAKLIKNLNRPEPPLGCLFAVPSLPAHFLGRKELMRRIKDAVLIDLQRPVVITGEASRVGLQGMGGIGKSVLAAALARDREIRWSYPDGIIWVSVGKQPNLVQLQRDVARHLGSSDYFDTEVQGQGILKQLMADKAVFLVLDDVWKAKDAIAFDVLGPRCRALVTTRDAGIMRTLHGELHQVDLLTKDQSLQLLADAVGKERQSLPPEALEVVKECDCLPLAIALCGGMAKKRGGEWDAILQRLRRAELEKIADREAINEQHQSIWRAMQASVDMLQPDEQRLFAELAVFPTDRAIPEAAVDTLWSHTGKLDTLDTEDLLIELEERSLIRLDRSTTRTEEKTTTAVSMHDLLHDYATRIAGDLTALHQSLLHAYQSRCPDGWPSGPNDGYFFQELAYHLAAAGQVEELVNLLFDFNWLQAKAVNSLLQELLHDYDEALQALPSDDSQRRSLELMKGGLKLSSHVVAESPDQLAGQLIGRMDDFSNPEIKKTLETAKAWRGEPWLRPLHASLHPPGTALLLNLVGHSSRVETVAITPDGLRAVSGSSDETLKVWDLETGKELKTLEGHRNVVYTVAITPDGLRAVSGSSDNTLKVWDLETGKELNTLRGHSEKVNTVAITPDGLRAVSGSSDNTLKVWDLETGKELNTLRGHSKEVTTLAITPDGRRAVSFSSWEVYLRVWDLKTGEELKTLRVGTTYDIMKTIEENLKTLRGHGFGVNTLSITPDGHRAVSLGSHDSALKVWDLETGKELNTLRGHSETVTTLAITPDGRRAVSGSYDTLKVWDLETGEELNTLRGHSETVTTLAITPDGRRAVSGSYDTLKVWDLETGEELKTLRGHSETVTTVAITPDGLRAVSGSGDKTLKVWDLETGEELKTLRGHSFHVTTIAITPDGGKAVSGSWDKTCKVWDLETGEELKTLRGHSSSVTTIAITPDGLRAVSGSGDKTCKVWDLETGEELKTLRGHSDSVCTVAITPDGFRSVSGSWDETLKVWDLKEKEVVKTLLRHTGMIDGVIAITPDGRRAVFGPGDKTLKVCDLETGEEPKTLRGHSDSVCTVAITPDGFRSVSGSWDETLKVWDLETGYIIASFTGESRITSTAVAPDARTIVAGSSSGSVHILKLVEVD